MKTAISILFCFRNVAPLRSVAGTAEVVLDAVAENARFAFSVLSCVLLRAKHDGLTTILSIDAVDGFIKPFLLLVFLGIVVNEVGLDG